PTYEAISYTWGDATKVRIITIGGKKVEITANAFQVISRRASYWEPKLIWIDSVCINQKDLEERSRQVQLMRELYRNASRVI
ncbi:heterokaryon incompatibility, partial [Hyaloscypha hepaticicola]